MPLRTTSVIPQTGGVTWVSLDTSRSAIISLFGEKGRTLFGFLLSSSCLLPAQEPMAAYSGRLCDLARQLKWSPDTVKRYVAVFRALHLVQHFHDRRREAATLHIPLGPYHPLTNFALLDEVIQRTRMKQRQLAVRIKARYIERFGDPTLALSPEERTHFQALSAILDEEHLEPLKRQRLQIKIADLLTQLLTTKHQEGDQNPLNSDANAPNLSRMTREAGDLHALRGDRSRPSLSHNEKGAEAVGDANRHRGDLRIASEALAIQILEPQGDLKLIREDVNIPFSASPERTNRWQGDLHVNGEDVNSIFPAPPERTHQQQGDTAYSKGDSTPTLAAHSTFEAEKQGDLTRQKGDQTGQDCLTNDVQKGDPTQQGAPKEGDVVTEAVGNMAANVPTTYNVNDLISNISGNNVLRKHLAQFLAGILEKQDVENGYPTFTKYLKAFHRYTPEVIGRAFLATMVLLHRKGWRVESPGAMFTTQCKMLCGERPLSHYTLADVEAWLQVWGDLPYHELLQVLTTPSPGPAFSKPVALITTNSQGGVPSTATRYAGWSQIPRKQGRTYGMFYTGKPTARKGFNTTGSPYPPQSEQR